MTKASSGRVFPLTHALPPYVEQDGDTLHLKAGWFTGCNPVAYFLCGLGIAMGWIGVVLLWDTGIQNIVFLGLGVLPFFGIALWLASHRTHWHLESHTIRKKSAYA